MDASYISSVTSLSRTPSPVTPLRTRTTALPTIDDLIAYLLDAKRSLTSTQHLLRANALVSETSIVLTSLATTSAGTTFLSRGIHTQLITLDAIKQGLVEIAEHGEQDFAMVLRKLDQADVQIKSMLDILRETVVDPALGHATASNASTSSVAIQEHQASPLASAQKTLHHFIDETAPETILASFHLSIDEVADATKSLALTIATFTSELESIASVLTAVDNVVVISQGSSEFGAHLGNAKPNKNGREQKLNLPATAAMYQEMEEHATEMAILVQGLMTHYELCVKALRHTDGGSEIVAQEQAGIERSIEGSSQDFMIDMSPHERAEMLLVLSHDASELEDVTSEIGDRLADMESLHTHITCASDAVEQSHDDLKAAVVQMTEVQEKLALYIEAGAIFDRRWKEQKEEILAKMEELEGLRSFYEGFVRAYEGLVQEVARRDGIREKVDRVMKEAMRKAERLYEDDLQARETFQAVHGEYLPKDIWPNLMDVPTRYRITSADPVDPQSVGDDTNVEDNNMKRSL